MKCKHYLEDFGGICIAAASVCRPGSVERACYCLHGQHGLCPVYLRVEMLERYCGDLARSEALSVAPPEQYIGK